MKQRAPIAAPPHVMPLEEFPPAHLARILEAVAQPDPPPRWLDLGIAQIQSRAWKEWYRARGIDPEKRREPLLRWVREAVIARDGYVCQLCGGDVEPSDVHIDHVHPVSKGGTNDMDNLQVAHSKCNFKKGAHT